MKLLISNDEKLNIYNLKVSENTNLFLERILLDYKEVLSKDYIIHTSNNISTDYIPKMPNNKQVLHSELIETKIEPLKGSFDQHYALTYRVFYEHRPLMYSLLLEYIKNKGSLNGLSLYVDFLKKANKEIPMWWQETKKEQKLTIQEKLALLKEFFGTLNIEHVKNITDIDSIFNKRKYEKGLINHKILQKEPFKGLKILKK